MNEPAFVEALATYAAVRRYDKEDLVASESEIAREWFIVLKGTLHAETAEKICIFKVSEGQSFGEVLLWPIVCYI